MIVPGFVLSRSKRSRNENAEDGQTIPNDKNYTNFHMVDCAIVRVSNACSASDWPTTERWRVLEEFEKLQSL